MSAGCYSLNIRHQPPPDTASQDVTVVMLQTIHRQSCTVTEKALTRDFSWLKAPNSAFTFNTLIWDYNKQPPIPCDNCVGVPILRLLSSSRFQLGEDPSGGLLRDYEPSDVGWTFVSSSSGAPSVQYPWVTWHMYNTCTEDAFDHTSNYLETLFARRNLAVLFISASNRIWSITARARPWHVTMTSALQFWHRYTSTYIWHSQSSEKAPIHAFSFST